MVNRKERKGETAECMWVSPVFNFISVCFACFISEVVAEAGFWGPWVCTLQLHAAAGQAATPRGGDTTPD